MLNETAQKIFQMKYAQYGESWLEASYRVSKYVASAEETEELRNEWETKFLNLIYNLVFIPGGRILANAGTDIKNLLNCFVLPVEDSRESIYGTLQKAAEIFAHGGGIGYDFSPIREEGAQIKTTGGKASGPLSFMTLFDTTGDVIQQASRRGAQMGILSIDHPDIEKFIHYKSTPNVRTARLISEYKRNLKQVGMNADGHKYFQVLEKTLQDDQLSHFNISVLLSKEFMEAVEKNEEWPLISRYTDSPVKTVSAKELFNTLSQMAWESGDPGVLFFDRANRDNMVKYLGDLRATNPCAEIWLLPYEPCCLGSINLHAFYDKETNGINFEFLEFAVRTSVRFLDNVQTKTEIPIEEINTWSQGLRRIGLGVVGWADLLAELGLAYDSDDAINLGNYLSWFISFFGWLESINLGQEKGVFPFYDPELADLTVVEKTLQSKYVPYKLDMEQVRKAGFRNVAVTAIAPTGTIALIAGVNSGIEPFFGLAYKRNITEGSGNTAKDYVIEINPILLEKIKDLENLESIKKEILKRGTLKDVQEIPEIVKSQLRTSHEIPPEKHVDMLAAWQEYVDNSISKTINFSENATVEDIGDIYFYAYRKGVKGLTVYRDNSKSFQILNLGTK
jgi:ribonucleoside-diphosphate reductase alpha chain